VNTVEVFLYLLISPYASTVSTERLRAGQGIIQSFDYSNRRVYYVFDLVRD